MLSVQNLKKVYKSKKKGECAALKGVSFDLPSTGMIFVLGESGSGKSTLLNILGGLDEFDGGKIIADGNDLSKLSPSEYYDYRGSYAGFVFQDYCLLDEMTVEQNVALSLDINGCDEYEQVKDALEKVGMAELAERFPSELSGGQKQRVAIARAIVKNPNVILCDEPTGNLDQKTAVNILKLLKSISESRLVVLVSHNREDAFAYADRILELGDGKIINDISREKGYRNKLEWKENTLYLPYKKNLDEGEIETLRKAIKTNRAEKFVQRGNGFEKTEPQTLIEKDVKLKRPKTSFKQSLKLSGVFMKRKAFSYIVTAILTTLIISCFALFQSFLYFDGNAATVETLEKHGIHSLALQKGVEELGGTINTSKLIKIQDEEIQTFYDAGYEGKVFKLYNHAIVTGPNVGDVISSEKSHSISSNLRYFYIGETYGVLECNESFLNQTFGNGEAVTVLAGSLDNFENGGIVITDYVADSLIYFSGKYASYDQLIGVYKYVTGTSYAKINAVIETGYQERYAELIESFKQLDPTKISYEEAYETLTSREIFLNFAEEVKLFLGIGYTFSEDYISALEENPETLGFAKLQNYTLMGDKNSYNDEELKTFFASSARDVGLEAGEMALPYQIANEIFNTSYSLSNLSSFEPRKVTLKIEQENGEGLTREFTVKKLHSSNIAVADEDMRYFRRLDVIPYALYFDDISQAGLLSEMAKENFYAVSSLFSESISRVGNMIVIFEDIFYIAEVILLLICALFLVNFGISSVKRNTYQIGVIKALGSKTSQIGGIFVRQTLLVGVLILLLSVGGIYFITQFSNAVLLAALKAYMRSFIFDITIIEFIPQLVCLDLIMVVFVSLISAFIPIVWIHNIKPIKIIKAKE